MSELMELSVAEVAKMAEVVAARINHPSCNAVQAVRAGIAAVNGMRLAAADVAPVELVVPKYAPGTMPRPVEARKPLAVPPPGKRRVSHLGVAERAFVWEDADGDHWQWSVAAQVWQYKQFDDPNGPQWVDCPSDFADHAPTARYAPFTEVGRSGV